eukprot:CAMPEP_0117630816 /NCGR_PEP_ID=MMETSP0802-20121206/3700_1 /TAXON_ID=38833 /ORGANISM="Micromonas sp., Strain CCMP2099" /LENGTH=667 /DNA_ID=CAMNT_0005435117 /DNA_START=189 /DNA_END=2192 /DNA_ORIENTATION=-
MTASKMTVAQLRAALVEKGLVGTGLKPALVARLESATSGSGGADAKETSDDPQAPGADKGDDPDGANDEDGANEDADDEKKKADDDDVAKKRAPKPSARGKRARETGDDAAGADESKKNTKKTKKDGTQTHGKDKGKEKPCFELDVRGNEGRVIGKGGETIRNLEHTHGVKIEMRRDRGVAIVSGDPAVFETVKAAICDLIENGDTSRPVGGGGVGGGGRPVSQQHGQQHQHQQQQQQHQPTSQSLLRHPDPDEVLPFDLQGDDVETYVEIQVACPGKEGRVIGKQGATIKEIERQSGASMKVTKGSGFCDIKGKKGSVINARRAVLDTLALQVDRFVGNAAAVQGDWQCGACGANVFASKPNCFACGAGKPAQGGAAMGAGGYGAAAMGGGGYGAPMAAMGGMEHAYGYGAPVAQQYGGHYQPMAGAVPGVMGGGQSSQSQTVSVEVPCRGSEGRVIGKGGEMIKHIQTQTGTKLDMKRDVGTVVVTGTAQGVQMAQGLLNEVIENGDTRDKGGMVAAAYGGGGAPGAMAQHVQQPHPSAMGGQPVLMAVPVNQAHAGVYAPQGYYATPQGYYAPVAAYGQHAPQQAYAPQAATQQALTYDPNVAAYAAAAQQATASAEWGVAPQAGGIAPQAAAPAPQQQGEWQTHYSEGRAYYYNVATGETRWA